MALTTEEKLERVKDFRPIDDGTDIADLMTCFTKKEVNHPKFPALSSEVRRLKETGGVGLAMSAVMEKYEKIAADTAVRNDHIEKIQKMIQEGCSKELILKIGYTQEEYDEAENKMMQLI